MIAAFVVISGFSGCAARCQRRITGISGQRLTLFLVNTIGAIGLMPDLGIDKAGHE